MNRISYGNRQTQTLTSDIELQLSDNMSYQYDERDRLTKVVLQNGSEVTYRYDGDNLLTERIVAGEVTRYYYDENQIIAEGKIQSDGSVIETVSYLRGNALAMLEETDGTKGYYLLNGHGDVISILGENGEKLNTYDYDIWGNPLSSQEQVTNSFMYSGELWDEAIELQYLRTRWYDPSIGRFITEDTFEGDLNDPLSLNLYTYVINNPLKYIDPTGNDKLPNAQIGGAGGSRVVGLNTKGSTSKSTTTNNNSKTTNNKTSSSGNTANNSESLRQELSSLKGKGKPESTKHSEFRKNETGRPIGQVVNDIQRARTKDILIEENGNIIVRGNNGRVHVLSPDGQRHITTLTRTDKNVQNLINQGRYNYATEEQAQNIINMYK